MTEPDDAETSWLRMKHDDLCDQPLDIHADFGAVVLLGPDGVSLAMTVDAAETSAHLLMQAVDEAKGGAAPTD